MTLTADLQSIVDMDVEDLAMQIEESNFSELTDDGGGRMIGARRIARRVAPDRGALMAGLTMSAACVGSVLVASMLHRGSPWAGVNAITSGFGLVGRRPRRSFDARLASISLASIVGGSLVLGTLVSKLTPARGIGLVGGGVMAAIGSFAMDRFLMRRTMLPALRRSLGPIGMLGMYGAIGLGAILGRRRG